MVYGARSPGMLLYKDELTAWEKRDDIDVHITVDGTDDPDWKYNVGFVPASPSKKRRRRTRTATPLSAARPS